LPFNRRFCIFRNVFNIRVGIRQIYLELADTKRGEVYNSDKERTKRKGGEAIEILRWQFHLNGLPSYITDFGERLLKTFGPEYRITEAAYIQINQGSAY
jgi:hypothetical protein